MKHTVCAGVAPKLQVLPCTFAHVRLPPHLPQHRSWHAFECAWHLHRFAPEFDQAELAILHQKLVQPDTDLACDAVVQLVRQIRRLVPAHDRRELCNMWFAAYTEATTLLYAYASCALVVVCNTAEARGLPIG